MFKYSFFCIIIYCLNPLMEFIRPFNFPHNTNMTYWNILSNNSFYKKLYEKLKMLLFKSRWNKIKLLKINKLIQSNHNIFTHLGLPKREIQFQNFSKILSQSKKIPTEKIALLQLPGVGTYVASAYRSLHLRSRDTLIDSNIVRFYGRFFGFQYSDLTRKQKNIYELSERISPKYIYLEDLTTAY